MQKREDIVSKFLNEGNNFAKKITDEYIVEQKMFQLLEHEVLKILNLSSQPNGNLVKLLLMSNVLASAEIDNLDFEINFEPTYLENTAEKARIQLIREDIVNTENLDNPESVVTYRDLKLLEIEDFEDSFNKDIPDELLSMDDEEELKHKAHLLLNDEDNDIYIEEVPLYDGRISHIFTKKTDIKVLLQFILSYIPNHHHALFLTALILFEVENLSSNKFVRNYYYHDIVDRVNPDRQWFTCLDIKLSFLKPLVTVINENDEEQLIDKECFIQIC